MQSNARRAYNGLLQPSCFFSLHVLKKDWYISDAALLDKLRSKIKPLLKDLEKLDYHALEIVEFAYGSHLDEYVRFIEQRIDALKDGSEVEKSKRVIPYDGIPCIRNAITNQEQFNKFVEKIVEWNSTDSLGRFDVRHLLKPISDIKNDSQESMLALWIKSKLTVVNDQSFKDVVSLMQLLEFRQLDESSYLLLLETGNKVNLFKQAKGVFQWYLDSGAMKSRVGEVPEILNEKLDMCKRLIEQASPG